MFRDDLQNDNLTCFGILVYLWKNGIVGSLNGSLVFLFWCIRNIGSLVIKVHSSRTCEVTTSLVSNERNKTISATVVVTIPWYLASIEEIPV